MYTLAELQEFAQFVLANVSPGPRRSGVVHFFQYARELLVETRREMVEASANGQLQRSLPPARATMVRAAIDDAAAIMEAMTGLSGSPSQKLQDFAFWVATLIPPGVRRTQMARLVNEASILEDTVRRRFIAASVNGQLHRATPPARAQMVSDALADAQALLDAMAGLPTEKE